jgi:leucyl-tRNA synthetase
MELSNHLAKFNDRSAQGIAVRHEALSAIVRMLAPITPHICESMWKALGASEALYAGPWPVVDESAREKSVVTVVVQVNGKLRARLELPPGASRDAAYDAAMAVDNVERHTSGLSVRKVIHVPDKLLNIVVG